ncbi:S8 family serine peptidase [Candidatus Binatia bacterium]|jgi:hypothetical protein|nr:S8 family serine peptidase [Candidatus Binatia bacterium]
MHRAPSRGISATSLRLAPLVTALALAIASPAAAQTLKAFKSTRYERNADLEKVAPPLLVARQRLRAGQSRAQARQAMPSVPMQAEAPEIDVRLTSAAPDVVEALRAAGMEISAVYEKLGRVIGICDPLLLDRVAAVPEVRSIQPNYRPLVNVGAVTSQADTAIRAADARAAFGVDGSGVPVGVLSDSFNAKGGGVVGGSGCSRAVTGTSSQDSGDLPTSVKVFQDLSGQSDEGRAMAELVHDLAPGAPLLFATAFTSEPGFAANIDALRACGAKVLVDDVIYYAEPMFQDGVVAQAAQDAVAAGIPYFSSAGNYGRVGVDEEYVDGAPASPDDDFHRFASGNQVANITLPPGCGVRLVLQWAEPFDGTLGPGASSDFDIGLYDCSGAGCEPIDGASSDAPQGCSLQSGGPGGDPLEILESPANDSGTPQVVSVAVDRVCGSATRFRIGVTATEGCSLTGSGYAFDATVFNDAQIYGHAAAAGVVAVAAVDYREIEQGGDRTAPAGVINVERFSSLGGNLPFYYSGDGTPLPGGIQQRVKPEIAAPDGTNTTFFVQDADGDGFPNFFGTSAAAPHAAAVAALVREQNPSLSPAGVLATLTTTATDIEAQGYDFLSGFGLVDAVGAVGAATPSGPVVGVLENPQPGSFQSGIGLVSGWVCDADAVTFQIDGGEIIGAAYGTDRADTAGVCGDADNGFGSLLNWGLLGDGTHTITAFADGVEFGSATFEVATFGVPFLTGASGSYVLSDFPSDGQSTVIEWQEASQNFVISDRFAASSAASPDAALQGASLGVLENPGDGSAKSGIGVISGWVCSAAQVTVRIDGGNAIRAAYGTGRADTIGVCGDADNGFGVLFNWGLLGDGTHTATVFADGMPFGQAQFTVTTLGAPFVTGLAGEYRLPDFAGRDVFVRWQEAQQNFVVIGTE